MKLRKGDQIIVLSGKDKGRKGKVERVFPKSDAIVVGGINMYKKHAKKRDDKHPGGIISMTKPISASKTALICPTCGKPTKIGYQELKDEKVRVCRKCDRKL